MSQSLDRIRWQCRRGLLELDILLNAFLEKHYDAIPDTQKKFFLELLTYPDTQLLCWFTNSIEDVPVHLVPILRAIKDYPYVSAYVALGSNLNHPAQQLETAISALSTLPQSTLAAISSFYETTPVSLIEQPNFINAVVCLKTQLSARALLSSLQAIEQDQGRIRTKEKNGPRTLDLDLLMYGLDVIEEEGLSVPHPRLRERRFVLMPWVEIASECRLPDGASIQACVSGASGVCITAIAPKFIPV